MKILLIFLICIMLTCFVSASSENITLNYPLSINASQTFQVNLTLINFTGGLYDIKIDITNSSSDSDRISEMYNGSVWRSTNYYFYNATNTSSNNISLFQLNISRNYNGTGNITVSTRKSGHITADNIFSGYSINIIPQTTPTCTFSSTCGSWGTCSSSRQTKTCVNTSVTCVNTTYTVSQSCSSSKAINLEMDWNEDEIVNGDEFTITINVENLEEDNYAVRVWIENDDEDTISERYGNYSKEGDVWVSGKYYIYNFFKDSGDDSAEIKLRISEEYSSFSGDAKIFFALKDGDEEEISEGIEILAGEIDTENDSETVTTAYVQSNNSNLQTSSVITLTPKANLTTKRENSIIYKSKTEYIREYAPYAFSLICIFIMILMIIDKKHR